MTQAKCPNCQREFETKSWQHAYCSNECRQMAYWHRKWMEVQQHAVIEQREEKASAA